MFLFFFYLCKKANLHWKMRICNYKNGPINWFKSSFYHGPGSYLLLRHFWKIETACVDFPNFQIEIGNFCLFLMTAPLSYVIDVIQNYGSILNIIWTVFEEKYFLNNLYKVWRMLSENHNRRDKEKIENITNIKLYNFVKFCAKLPHATLDYRGIILY